MLQLNYFNFLTLQFHSIRTCSCLVVSTILAGATVGSFTGGALADKFGRTRTFQLDAIPLAIGAFLWSVTYPLTPWYARGIAEAILGTADLSVPLKLCTLSNRPQSELSN
ncbi:plastidic glucose transporter 4-like [Magnolia sinica]|uniref:plastidic glucose transporter 4-like n=1 Tax=Magnolia sinica TaxID=86752 RepID=UPI0026582AE6|nr:plastidic glucose transporter 4-like [Magnolia sinica]